MVMANGEGGISIGTIIMGIIAYNIFFSGNDEEKTIKKQYVKKTM